MVWFHFREDFCDIYKIMAQYTVKKGDSLSQIGASLGMPWQKLYEANKATIGANPNLIKPGQVLTVPEATPVSVAEEKPAGDITTAPKEAPTGSLSNLRTALRDALNEAGKRRMASQFEQVGGAVGEFTPGTISSVAEMIRKGVETPVESVFKDITTALKDQQDFAQTMIAKYPDAGIMMTDAPETIARKASRAPSFLESIKGQPTLAEKEQEEARRMTGELDKKRGPGGFVDYTKYREQRARSLLGPDEFDRRFAGLYLSEGDRERLRDESASASTRTAADFSKAEQIVQANIDAIKAASISDRSRLATEVVSIIQRRTTLTEAEIKVIMERFGFQKREGVGWMLIGG